MEDLRSLSLPHDEKLVSIDNTKKMKEISSTFSNIYNRYCIEIVHNDEILTPLKIITTEPWVTYLFLMRNYLIAGYSEVHDLTKPIIYYFLKEDNGNLIFKVNDQVDDHYEVEYHLPEQEFLMLIFENLNNYIEIMKQYNLNYVNYWMKRFEKDLNFVSKELENR